MYLIHKKSITQQQTKKHVQIFAHQWTKQSILILTWTFLYFYTTPVRISCSEPKNQELSIDQYQKSIKNCDNLTKMQWCSTIYQWQEHTLYKNLFLNNDWPCVKWWSRKLKYTCHEKKYPNFGPCLAFLLSLPRIFQVIKLSFRTSVIVCWFLEAIIATTILRFWTSS